MNELEEIKGLITQGDVDEAIRQLESLIETDVPSKDQAYYLLGNAWRKKGNWQQALNHYGRAIELTPDSPALHARQMAMEILEFYNKDMYNQ